ncbi:MAG: PadR family transcriptional regulator [Acidobacteriota bacterium]
MPDDRPAPPTAPLKPRDFLILLALAGGERHGYGLIQDIRELSDDRVHMDPANLYRALRRMVRDGLVLDSGRRAGDGGAERRVYRLSDAGRQTAADEAQRLERLTVAARARRLITGPGVTT